MSDLPWRPTAGQTALRVVERSEAFVICEDKHSGAVRYLFTLGGVLRTISGSRLTLQARVMKPERPPEPDTPRPPKTPEKPAQMTLF